MDDCRVITGLHGKRAGRVPTRQGNSGELWGTQGKSRELRGTRGNSQDSIGGVSSCIAASGRSLLREPLITIGGSFVSEYKTRVIASGYPSALLPA
jgi:hypothetical protein